MKEIPQGYRDYYDNLPEYEYELFEMYEQAQIDKDLNKCVCLYHKLEEVLGDEEFSEYLELQEWKNFKKNYKGGK